MLHSFSTSSSQSSTQPNPINKTFDDLIADVFKGMYTEFRAYIQGRDMTILNLSDRCPAGSDLSRLAKAIVNTDIVEVDLSENDLNGNDFLIFLRTLVKKHKKIEILNCYSCNIDNNAIAEIGLLIGPCGLSEFDASFNKFNDAAAIALVKNLEDSDLERLSLFNNALGDEAAIGIAKALKKTKIKIIELAGSNISLNGFTQFCALVVKTQVIRAIIYGNQLTEANISASPKSMQHLAKCIDQKQVISLGSETGLSSLFSSEPEFDVPVCNSFSNNFTPYLNKSRDAFSSQSDEPENENNGVKKKKRI